MSGFQEFPTKNPPLLHPGVEYHVRLNADGTATALFWDEEAGSWVEHPGGDLIDADFDVRDAAGGPPPALPPTESP